MCRVKNIVTIKKDIEINIYIKEDSIVQFQSMWDIIK